MRITGGELRGRRLQAPVSAKLRPALDQVRESIFNIIAVRLDGALVLDAFAGTGLLGLESLSRGAREVVFVEIHRPTADRLRTLLVNWNLNERAEVVNRDFLRAAGHLTNEGPYDLIFIDPPYPAKLVEKAVNEVASTGMLAPGGLLVVKHLQSEPPSIPPGMIMWNRQRSYGDAKVTFLTIPEKAKVNHE